MQGGNVAMKSLSAIAGVLLSALAACAVDDPANTGGDQLADPAENMESQETAITGSVAEGPSLPSAERPDQQSSLQFTRSGITPQACTTTCRDVVHPELCLIIPFPFCLIPQHDCVTLCSAP